MKKVYWAVYGILFIIRLFIKKVQFERLKKSMTSEEIYKYVSAYATKCARDIMARTGSKVEVVGLENLPEESCLFVSNHQEYFDILVMLGYINKPMGFIAKKELKAIPVVSYWMEQIHCAFIDREDPRESVKAILKGVDNLNNGYSMHIAPEGTRSKGPKLGEFKKGSMKLAIKAQVPIVPVTLINVYKMTDGKSFLNIRPANIKIIISKPIPTKNTSREEQNNLSETVREIIRGNLNQ